MPQITSLQGLRFRVKGFRVWGFGVADSSSG